MVSYMLIWLYVVFTTKYKDKKLKTFFLKNVKVLNNPTTL